MASRTSESDAARPRSAASFEKQPLVDEPVERLQRQAQLLGDFGREVLAEGFAVL